jgi:hypothetical protein
MGKRKPRANKNPASIKKPRAIEDADSIGLRFFRWRASNKYVDYDHKNWGWGKLSCRDFFNILIERLHEYERISWSDLEKRKSCHPMPIDKIENKAQERLSEKFDGEIESLYQIDINPKCRIWGYREQETFYLIWHDPEHSVYKIR